MKIGVIIDWSVTYGCFVIVQRAEEQLVLNEAEQKQVREQQDDTINKVLASQKELSSE